jgi:hypothetical protein
MGIPRRSAPLALHPCRREGQSPLVSHARRERSERRETTRLQEGRQSGREAPWRAWRRAAPSWGGPVGAPLGAGPRTPAGLVQAPLSARSRLKPRLEEQSV